MAERAKITIRVSSSRTGTTVAFTTNGRYKALTTAGYQREITGLPLQPNGAINAFWLAILADVVASITSDPGTP